MILLASSECLTGDEVNQAPIQHTSDTKQAFQSDVEDLDAEVAVRERLETERITSVKDWDRHARLLEDELTVVRGESQNERQRRMKLELQAPTQQHEKQSRMIQTESLDEDISDQQITSVARNKRDIQGGKQFRRVQWAEKQDRRRKEKEAKWNDLQSDIKKVQDVLAEVRRKVERTNIEIESKPGKSRFQVP
jgi:hypothetical protein